ncbi:MAG: methyltransferase [Alphaproteobacteria bacterium]|nr:methyltransferase [Alphaproteobacteria bacterium]
MSIKQEFFTLMSGRVKMRRGHYNPTSDAVWLAAFAPRGATTVLDVGIGSGGVGLCYLANNPAAQITGLDIQTDMLTDAQTNAKLNNANLELINADITTWRTGRTFDLVLTNPPYFRGTPARHNAHHNADLTAWVRKCVARTRPNGYFCIITDAPTVTTVLSAMTAARLGDINIFPLFGAKNTAERVILRGRVGSHAGATLHHGLSMNYEPILRDGLTIDECLSKLSQK